MSEKNELALKLLDDMLKGLMRELQSPSAYQQRHANSRQNIQKIINLFGTFLSKVNIDQDGDGFVKVLEKIQEINEQIDSAFSLLDDLDLSGIDFKKPFGKSRNKGL